MAKVVVIGGGYGGITVAGGLDDVADVTLVEQKDQFVHHAAALRAAVDSVWGHTVFMPYSRLLDRGKVVHGTCMRVDGRTVYVAGHDPIEADFLVLATGTTYPFQQNTWFLKPRSRRRVWIKLAKTWLVLSG